jgi:phospholipase C
MTKKLKSAIQKSIATILALTTALGPSTLPAFAASTPARNAPSTATPIQHLVVIFQENVSFDHYFATYPNAANPSGEPRFKHSRARRPSMA